MGWFNSLFKKKEPLEVEEVALEDISKWFESKISERLDDINDETKGIIDSIYKQKELIKEKLKELENAKLRNENIPLRAKQIMEGNRKTYITLVNQFIDNIAAPKEINYDTVKDFIGTFSSLLDSFSKSSARSFYILQEFFGNETKVIANSIKKIEEFVSEMLTDEHKDIIKTKERILELNKALENKKEVHKRIAEEKEKLDSNQNLIVETELELSNLKKSSNFKEVSTLTEEKEKLKEDLRKNNDGITQLFSPLERPLKKYSRIALENEDIINKYLGDSVAGLLKDEDLKILLVLDGLKKVIDKEGIELKDKQKEKIIEVIGNIKPELLTNLVLKHNEIKDSINDLDKRLRVNSALNDLERLEYKLKHLKESQEKLEAGMEKLENLKESSNLESLKENVLGEIKKLTNTELKVA